MNFIIKRNDVGYQLNYQLTNDDGSFPDLTGASVQFNVGDNVSLIISNPAIIVTPSSADVSYTFTNKDTLVSGNYIAEFQVTFPNGNILTYPRSGYIVVNIQANVDTSLNNVIVSEIAAKEGDFETKLNQILANNSSLSEVIDARGTFSVLDDRLDNTDAQLAEKAQQSDLLNAIKLNRDIPNIKPLVTFVCDDGDLNDTNILKPISINKGIPFVSAVYPGCPNTANLKSLSDLGWEIIGHHQNSLETYPQTETDIRNAFLDTINYITGLGIEVKNHAYASGYSNPLIRRIASDYFDCVCATGAGNINTSPLRQFNLDRVPLGAFYNTGQGTDTYYKSMVDQAKANNGWLIFMIHAGNSQFDATQQTYLNNTIDYIKSLGIDIVTIEDGIEIIGNKKIIGDYSDVNTSDNYYVEGVNGIVLNKVAGVPLKNNTIVENLNTHSNSSVPSDFVANKITFTPIDVSNSTGFPNSQAGSLETYRIYSIDDKYTYQKYRKYNSEGFYTRSWKNGAWTSWVKDSFRLPVTVYNVPAQTIPANSMVSIAIPISGYVDYSDTVIANPYVSMENFLSWNVLIESPTVVRLRILNVTTGSIATAAKDWRIVIIKNSD